MAQEEGHDSVGEINTQQITLRIRHVCALRHACVLIVACRDTKDIGNVLIETFDKCYYKQSLQKVKYFFINLKNNKKRNRNRKKLERKTREPLTL